MASSTRSAAYSASLGREGVRDGVREAALSGVPVSGGPMQVRDVGPGRIAVSWARRASAKRWW